MEKTDEQMASDPAVSPLWIVLYLVADLTVEHLATWHDYSLLELRVLLCIAFSVFLLVLGRIREVRRHLFGSWIPRSFTGFFAILIATAGVNFLFGMYFGYARQSLSWNYVSQGIFIAPINEEPVFRGLFLGILLASMPRHRWAAVGVSALIFAAVHYYPPAYSPYLSFLAVLLLGLLTGVCFGITGSVPACMVCHALWNAMPMLPRG